VSAIVQRDVAPLERHLAPEGQQAPHDVAGRVGRLPDHLDVFLEILGRLLLEDVAHAHEHGERIVQLVGDASDELTERGELRGLDHLLLGERQAELLVFDHLLETLRRLLGLLEEARVVDRVRGVGGERVEELQVGLAEDAGGAGDLLLGEVDHADDPLGDPERHADEGATAVAWVVHLTESRVLLDVLHDDGFAHLDDPSSDALADLHLHRPATGLLETAPDRDAQGLALAVEQHDRPDARAHCTHRALEDVREEVLDARNTGGHLDHVVEGAELEDEVLEAFGRGAQLDEHSPERLRDLADLAHLPESRHRRRRPLGLRRLDSRHRAGRGGRGRCGWRHHDLPEGAAQLGDTRGEPPEQDVAEERDDQGEEDAELGFCRLQQPEAPHEVDEDQQGQNSGQREDRARRLAQPHGMLTTFRSSMTGSRPSVPLFFLV